MTTTQQVSPRIERAPLFVEAWEGVLARLRRIYSASSLTIGPKAVTVMPLANPDEMEKMLLMQQDPLQLPAIGIGVTQVEPNLAGGYNTTASRWVGHQMQVDDSRDTWIMAKVAPVLLTFQVTFLTEDLMTMLQMINVWMSTEHWGFVITVEQPSTLSFKIKVVPDKVVAVPPRSQGAGGTEQYKLSTNLRVEAYSGFFWRVPSIRVIETTIGIIKPGIKITAKNIDEVIADPENGIIVADTKFTKAVLEPRM